VLSKRECNPKNTKKRGIGWAIRSLNLKKGPNPSGFEPFSDLIKERVLNYTS
jgi:hypothetical protein